MKSLKSFRIYIIHSKVIAFVPNIAIKDILLQPDTEGKRGKQISKILEFDIEIRPTKLVKGQGLARLMAKSNYKALELNVEGSSGEISEYPNIFLFDYYKDIVYFLQNMNYPPEMEKYERRAFKLKAIKYCIMENNLYWKDPTEILLKCVDEEEAQRIMIEMHAGACEGHLY